MKTSYKGCNKKIKKSLKKGKHIKCWVWDKCEDDKEYEIIIAYIKGNIHPYISEVCRYEHAKPYKKEKSE